MSHAMNIIVLEHPRIRSEKHFNDIANTPLWSCLLAGYASAALRQAGMDVTLVDANMEGWDFRKTAREIADRSPDLLCINAVYFWEQTPELFDFIDHVRQLGFPGHVNLFGFFPSLAWDVVLPAVPSVDSIAVGECEVTLTELARILRDGGDWRRIPGLARRQGEGAGMADHRAPAADPDRFPFPDRQTVPGQTASILASRGCYNHCRFCPVPVFYNGGPLWRGRAPEKVVEEIVQLMDDGVRDFYFVDPNFIGPGRKGKRRAEVLCELMAPLGMTFGMETRANDLDSGLLDQLVSAGLTSLLIGIESGSPEILGELNKGGSIRAGEAAISLCRAAGIEPEVGFLMFVPDSTVADLAANLAFLQRNRLLDRLDRTANLMCHRQIVFRGTSGYERFSARNRVIETGCLGFQAEIRYRDPRVYWISEVMVNACLFILKQTGRPESPLYWKKHGDWQGVRCVNDYLVGLFVSLLTQATANNDLPAVETVSQTVEAEILTQISSLDFTG